MCATHGLLLDSGRAKDDGKYDILHSQIFLHLEFRVQPSRFTIYLTRKDVKTFTGTVYKWLDSSLKEDGRITCLRVIRRGDLFAGGASGANSRTGPTSS